MSFQINNQPSPPPPPPPPPPRQWGQNNGVKCTSCFERERMCTSRMDTKGPRACSQCLRYQNQCSFVNGEGMNSAAYVSSKSTSYSPSPAPHLDSNASHDQLDGNEAQQASGLPAKLESWDWIAENLRPQYCSDKWRFHMTSYDYLHDKALCNSMASKFNIYAQQALNLPVALTSWDWIAQGSSVQIAMEMSKSSPCLPDWQFHIQIYGHQECHNTLLCGWMAAKMNALLSKLYPQQR